MNSFGVSDKGLLRKINQDCYKIVSQSEDTLAVVCDGIGGNKAGEIASVLASEVLCNYFKNNYMKDKITEWYNNAIQIVNAAVLQKSSTVKEYEGMGTTLVSALITDEKTYIANIGDSRCYIITNENELKQITDDHTVLNELVLKKGIDYSIASQFVGKNVISRAIGIEENIKADIYELNNWDYKILLLCSDGLHGYVDEKTIRTVLNDNSNLESKCQKLVDEANEKGGFDNVTVVLCRR